MARDIVGCHKTLECHNQWLDNKNSFTEACVKSRSGHMSDEATLHCQGRGWWEGTGAAEKNCIVRRRIIRRRTRSKHRGKFRKTMTLLYAKGAGAACAERDQY